MLPASTPYEGNSKCFWNLSKQTNRANDVQTYTEIRILLYYSGLESSSQNEHLTNTAILWEEHNKIFKRQTMELLISPKINLICFHNKTVLASPFSKRYLSAFLKDYTHLNHLPASS